MTSPSPDGAAAHTPAYGTVDLATCDREPIHVPGAIQPHGVLLAVDHAKTVVAASANCDRLLGVESAAALGRPLADLLGTALVELAVDGVPDASLADNFVATVPEVTGRDGVLLGQEAEVRSHRSGERIVVELEKAGQVMSSVLTLRASRAAVGRLAAHRDVVGLAGQLTAEMRSLLGFDRVMVYRFDEDWNGEVIAEDHRPDLNSFLGLHYPATDIPAQARRLYTMNWTRLIPDIHYVPVPLDPILDPGTGEPLDLSHSSLRSVSPIHVEYLANMGVDASMSVSLVNDGRLWGLVACHHYSGPHRPSQDARASAEVLGQLASQMLSDREQHQLRLARQDTFDLLSSATTRMSRYADAPYLALLDDPDVLAMLDAQGAALLQDGHLTTVGDVPDEATLRRIADALGRSEGEVASSDRLSDLDSGLAEVVEQAAGALRIGSASDRWVLWLRRELVHAVDWGGDPTNKALAEREGRLRLSPRKSFDKWRQEVRGRSLPWTASQVDAADALAHHVTSLLVQRSQEQIEMAQSLQSSVMLDRAPTIEGMEVAATYLPASSYQLGGDWWDAVDLGDGRAAFVVGDVAGHGVSAASAMVQVRTALRAFLFEGHGPETCLDYLDAFLVELVEERVASVVIAVVDRLTGTVQVSSAGHIPPMVEDADGLRSVEVDPRPPLGVGLGKAESTYLRLEPGDTMVLFTDGLVERRGTDLTDSLDRLEEAVQGMRGQDLDRWAEKLVASHGVSADDDTTVLVLRLPA